MKKPVCFSAIACALILAGPVRPALSVPSITVGTHYLQPNTPGQVVEIYVTGGDPVETLSLVLQVANGGPEMELIGAPYALPLGAGIAGPKITHVDTITGTIFAANNNGQEIASDGPVVLPQVAFVDTITAVGTVSADGLLARVTLDTTGLFTGTFALDLTSFGAPTVVNGLQANLTDGLLVINSAPDTPNHAPYVNAGLDQSVIGGSVVQLPGIGVDPQALPLTYSWVQTDGPPVVLYDALSPTATFTAPEDLVNIRLTFALTVSNGLNTATDSVTIAVNVEPSLFTVTAGQDQAVSAGAFVELTAYNTAVNPRAVAYEWVQVGGPTVVLTGANTGRATFLAPSDVTNTVLSFMVLASDPLGETADTVDVHVNARPTNPTAYAGPDQAVAGGATVQLAGGGSDPGSLGLYYAWVQIDGPQVELSNEAIANPTFIAPKLAAASRLEFELRAAAGGLLSIDTVVIHVAASPDAAPPASDTDDEANYPAPSPTQQLATQPSSWTTATMIAVGIGLLILALLLIWILL